MPLYQYQCHCGESFEAFFRLQENSDLAQCPKCLRMSNKVIVIGGGHIFREEAPWLNDVLKIIDKDTDKPHVKKFLQEPTRTNWKAWMKGEGIRPMEKGEELRRKREPRDRRKTVDAMMKALQEGRGGSI